MSATRKGQQVQALRIKKTKESNFMAIPVNTTIPTISGTAQVGQTLTASTGTWTNSPTVYVYQWASAGAPISGAAASSYIPVTSDIGNALAVYVTAANTSGHNKPTASAPTGAVINIIPANSTVPTISGTAQVGQTLTATTGTWTNNPTSFTYQWNRAGTAISGATASSYVPVTADIGNTLTVSVTAANTGGSSPRVTSAPTGAVINIIPANSTVPTISGTAQVGQTLTATTGTWTNNPTSFTYQWNRAGAAISGATASSYVPVTADIGNTLTVSVTAANTGGSSPRMTSAPTSTVAAAGSVPVNTGAPMISGTPQIGHVLTASTGQWTNSPTSYAYQWYTSAGGPPPQPIAGQTASIYTPVSANYTDYITVTVLALNASGSSAPARAQFTTAVDHAGTTVPVETGLPAITGTAQVGGTLTVSNGTWSGSPTSYTYQWLSSAIAPTNYVLPGGPISGATTNKYSPVAGDAGNTLACTVISQNSVGLSHGATSLTTSAVADETGLVSSGTAQVGHTLTASGGSGGYQWYHEGSAISGATSSTYTLQGSDQGDLISVYSNGVFSALVGPVIGTVVFYVSSSTGSDSNPGTFSQPWKTLAHVNAQTFSAGTSILFKRGDTWRTDGNSPNSLGAQLRPPSNGSATGGPIVFDAYGTGANPIIDGSFDASAMGAWTNAGTNLWQSTQTFPPASGYASGNPDNQANDVGNILWGFSAVGGANVPPTLLNASVGQMTGGGYGGIWYNPGDGTAHLTTQGQWNFNTDNNKVQIYSVGNPATVMPGLSLAIDTCALYINGVSYVIVQNFTFQFSGASPLFTNGTCTNIIIRDCVVQWGGGGNISGQSTRDSRYGDGIDIEGSMQHCTVERVWFHQNYDTGVGPQCYGAFQENIIMRNCVVDSGGAMFTEFFFAGSPTTDVLQVYNNTFVGNNGGWSCNPVQRPNGAPNVYGLYPGVLTQTNMSINNNIIADCYGALPAPGFGILGTEWAGSGNPSNPFTGNGVWLDYNCWPVNPNSTAAGHAQWIALSGANYAMSDWVKGTNVNGAGTFSPALEPHGIFGQDPLFVSQSGLNLSLQSGSPCRNTGANLYSSGVAWDYNKNPRPTSGPFTIGAFQ